MKEDKSHEAVIVVYSRDGTGTIVATLLGERLSADVVALAEKSRRRGVLGFVGAGFQASRGIASKLVGDPWSGARVPRRAPQHAGEVRERSTGARELYLVGPIWASRMAPAVRAFLIGADLSGVTVHSVIVQADPDFSGAEATQAEIRTLVERAGGTAGRTASVHGAAPGKRATRGEIETRLPAHFVGDAPAE